MTASDPRPADNDQCEPVTPEPPTDADAHGEGTRGGTPDGDSAVEIGGQKGPEPTRYGDWEKGGRCTDF